MESNTQNFNSIDNPSKPKKKKLKKIILIFFGIIGISALFLYFFPVIMGFVVKDNPPIDDSDLRLQRVEIPEEQNAYYDLIKLQKEVSEDPKEIEKYLSLEKWDGKIVEEIIKRNEKALLIFDEAYKKLYFQDPAFSDPEKISINSVLVTMGSWRTTSRISALKSLYLMKQDKNQEAFEEAIKSVKIGQKIQESQTNLIGYLVATAMKDIGLEAIQKILSYSNNLESEFLINYSNQFDDFYRNEEGFIKTFKVEYLFQISSIDAINYSVDENGLPNDFGHKLAYKFYFQPNKTKNISAENIRWQINNAEKPCGQIPLPDLEYESSDSPSFIDSYFTENFFGKISSDIIKISLSNVVQRKCQDDFIVGATQALITLKAYKIDNGSFPLFLSELTPKYLPQVPQDPFDGKDIKYSFDKKILYSIGEDMIDSGGSEGGIWTSMPDPTFKIEF